MKTHRLDIIELKMVHTNQILSSKVCSDLIEIYHCKSDIGQKTYVTNQKNGENRSDFELKVYKEIIKCFHLTKQLIFYYATIRYGCKINKDGQ